MGLTATERKVVKAKIKAEMNDLPIIAVANEVYPNMKPESARVEVQKNLQKPTVQEALEKAMASLGLTEDKLAGVVVDAMGATRTVIIRDKGIRRLPGESDEAYEERLSEGSFVDEKPDHSIRLKAANMAAQWMGVGKKSDEPPAPGGVTFNVQNNYMQGE